MPNYYEILKIAPTADTTEIESVLDAQYEQWSNLVTHQDPKLQLQAQQALQVIEQMRTTLLDPARRQVYDEAVGVGGAVGGLVDPDILLQVPARLGAAMTPHTPSAATATQAPVQPTGPGLWACSKGHDNPADTRYCLRCGEELVRVCPECGKLKSLHSTGLCGNCGYKYEVAVERKALSERISALNNEITSLRTQLEKVSKATTWGRGSTLFALGGIAALVGGLSFYFTTGPYEYAHDYLWMIGATVLFFVFWNYNSNSSNKSASVKNLTAELAPKERELALAQQRHGELSLRRTGE